MYQITGTRQGAAALERFEQALIAGPVRVERRGFFRGEILFLSSREESLARVSLGPVLKSFRHHTECRVMDTNFTIYSSGFFKQITRLENGSGSLVQFHKKLLSRWFSVQDWDGNRVQVRQAGPPWDRRYHLISGDETGPFTHFRSAPFRFQAALSLQPQPILAAGAAAGLAILLYYNWFLFTRVAILSAAGGGGS